MYLLVSILWICLLVAVSFIGSPMKLRAASVDLPVVRTVGLAPFRAFNKIEWLLGATLLGIGFVQITNGQINASAIWLSIFLLFTVAFQKFWIRPGLDLFAEEIMDGIDRPPSRRHEISVSLDVIKLVALIAVASVA